jgi:hypothetical protein
MKSTSEQIGGWLHNRELWLFGLIYVGLAMIELRLKVLLTPAWTDGTLAKNHQLLMQFEFTNNEQSRILQYWLPEAIRTVFGLRIEPAYAVQRWAIIFLAFLGFHFFLRCWFRTGVAFSGVAFFAAIIPFSFANDLQESSPLQLLTFVIGLWAIRENWRLLLILTLFIGGLNNETALVLPMVYFFYHLDSWNPRDLIRLALDSLLVALPLVLTILPMRYITADRPHLGAVWQLPYNTFFLANSWNANLIDLMQAPFQPWLSPVFIFGVFWIFALLGYRGSPLFLQRASWMIPFFISAHMVTGVIREARQMLPIGFILIPMALFYLIPDEGSTPSANSL